MSDWLRVDGMRVPLAIAVIRTGRKGVSRAAVGMTPRFKSGLKQC
jgi:hypothetical protein